MKNLFLFITLITLGVFTYIFEEQGGEERRADHESRTKLFNPDKLGRMLQFSTPKASLTQVRGRFITSEKKIDVDPKKIEHFFGVLENIRVDRFLTKKEIKDAGHENFFPDKDLEFNFIFEHGKIKFLLGKKIAISRSFYMEVDTGKKKQVVIAFDKSAIQGTYSQNQYDTTAEQYLRLKSLLYIKNEFFYDARIFPDFEKKKQKISKIHFNNFRQRSFTVNFSNNKTIPAPPKKIKVDARSIQALAKKILTLEGTTLYYPFKKELLNNHLAKLKIEGPNLNFNLTLFKEYGSLKGYFVEIEGRSFLYELAPENAKILFTHFQDLWDLRFAEFFTIKDFVIKKSKKNALLRVYNDKVFKVEKLSGTISQRPVHVAFKKLIEFLATGAQRVSEADRGGLPQGEYLFTLKFENSNIRVMVDNNELVLWHSSGVKLHYVTGDSIPFNKVLSDYFL